MFKPTENFFSKYFGKKVSEAEKLRLIPKEGDKIFNTDTKQCEVFQNGQWVLR